jgi:hypothetical protein
MRKAPVCLLVLGLFASVAPAAGAFVAGAASGGVARVALRSGDLTLTGASVPIVRQSPFEVDLRATVIDARGTGGGWAVTLGAPSAARATGAAAECLRIPRAHCPWAPSTIRSR